MFKKDTTLEIPIHIYSVYVDVFIISSEEKVVEKNNEILKLIDGEKEEEAYFNGRCYGIYLDKHNYARQTIIFKRKHFSPSLIAHEVFHAAYSILDRAGVVLCKESEEAFAYLIGYLTHEISNEL